MSNKKKRQQLTSRIIICTLFLPIFLFGFFLLGLAGQMITLHLQALSWSPVSATLLTRHAEHDGKTIGRASRPAGKFRYVWEDRVYESKQLSFSLMYSRSTSGAIDDWDDRLEATIGEVGQQFTARVNPQRPAEAVALPDVRWVEVAIYLAFGVLSVWAGGLFLFGMRDGKPKQTISFSWRSVAIMAVFGLPLLVLAPLLWRDEHGVWAVVVCLPTLIVINGVVHGIKLKLANKEVDKTDL